MKISKTMLRRNLQRLTGSYMEEHSTLPNDLSEYDDSIRHMRLQAEDSGDMPWVKLGLRYLLTTPDVRLRDYRGGLYPYHEEDLFELFEYTWNQLWPDESLGRPPDAFVELVEMPQADWLALRG